MIAQPTLLHQVTARRGFWAGLTLTVASLLATGTAGAQTRWLNGLAKGQYHQTSLGVWQAVADGRAAITQEHPLVRGTSAWKNFPDPDERLITVEITGLYVRRGWAWGYELLGGNSIGRAYHPDGGGRLRSTRIALGGLARGGLVIMESGGWVLMPGAGMGYGLTGDRFRADGLRPTPLGFSDIHDDVIVWTHGPLLEGMLELYWTPRWEEGFIELESRFTLGLSAGYRVHRPGRYWIVNDRIHQGERGGPLGVAGAIAGLSVGYGLVR